MKVKERGLILLTLFSISVLSGIFLLNNGIYNNNNNVVSATPDTINSNNPSSSGVSITFSPFFNHTTQDMQLYAKLADNSNSSFSNMFYDSFNNSNGTFTVINNTHYAQDLFYYGMGMGQYIYPAVILPGLYSSWNSTLWNSTLNAFVNDISANYSVRSNEATAFNNLLAIMFLFTGLGGSQTYGIDTTISNQWNSLMNSFWYSNAAGNVTALLGSNLDSNYLYASDNLLGAIVAYTIARESQLTSILRTNATTMGNEIMATINSSTTTSLYDSVNQGFFNKINLNGYYISDISKSLLTNALGITALLDWNIASDFNQNSSKVIQAEKIWNFMRYNSSFYNTTDNMYVDSVTRDGTIITNYNMNLLDNAWMLKATLDLFKTTGNFTYYNAALQQYYGIENHLYDKAHGGYFSSLNSLNNQTNQVKTLSSYSMLVAALYEFYDIYNSTSLAATPSQSQYIYFPEQVPGEGLFNVTANMNITMAFNYTSTVNTYWTINTPIENAPVEFTLRYPDNNTIIDDQTNPTNVNGTTTYLYTIPKNLPLNNYSLSIFCNKTGFGPAYNKTILPYVSGITIENQADIQQVFQNLYQGEQGLVNITFTSDRPDNISVQLQNSGQYFNSENLANIKIINNTETSVLMNFSAKDYSPLGWQDSVLSMFYNYSSTGSLLLYSQNISLYVSSAVELKYSFFRNYDVDFSPFNITLTLLNHRTSAFESLNLTINGTNFDPVSTNITSIAPQQSKTVEIQITPTIFALYGESDFNLTLYRNNTVVYTHIYTVDLVPAIQINGISTVDVITQGNTPYMSISITNYDLNSHEIIIKSNGQETYETTIKNGINYITAPISNSRFNNPYDVTTKTFNIEILDGNGKVLGTQTIILDVQLSPLYAIIFYVFPIVVAVALILYFKSKKIENEKRNK